MSIFKIKKPFFKDFLKNNFYVFDKAGAWDDVGTYLVMGKLEVVANKQSILF